MSEQTEGPDTAAVWDQMTCLDCGSLLAAEALLRCPSCASMRVTDSSGFQRRYGFHSYHVKGAPWFSLGIHVDWHTPTLDLHIGTWTFQVGKNNWEGESRWAVDSAQASGHTDQCTCVQAVAVRCVLHIRW